MVKARRASLTSFNVLLISSLFTLFIIFAFTTAICTAAELDTCSSTERNSAMAAPAKYSAVIVGGTGAIGREVVAELVSSPNCVKVLALVRKEFPKEDYPKKFPGIDTSKADKLELRAVDFDNLSEADFATTTAPPDTVKVGFGCLGTTRSDAGSAEAFRKVDFGYVTRSAQLSKEAGVTHYSLVSAMNANANSWFLYPKTKGEADNFVKDLKFPTLAIAKPGLIGRGDLARGVEKIAAWVTSAIPANTIAKAMIKDIESKVSGSNTTPFQELWNKDLHALAK